MFLKEVTFMLDQGCIYLIKNAVEVEYSKIVKSYFILE